MTKRERREQRLAEKEFRQKMRHYHFRPILEHACTKSCTQVPGIHDRAMIWDNFQLSQRKREVIDMEVIRARGRLNHEMTLIRQFQSTLDGTYIIRLSTTTQPTREHIGEIVFDELEDCQDYYNAAIRAFGFTEVSPVNDVLGDFFDDPDLDSGGDLDDFFGDSEDDLDGFFDDGPVDTYEDELDNFFG